MLKLYSIGALHGMLPEDTQKEITPGELKKLVQLHGTYRDFGKNKPIVMDAADLRYLMVRLSAQNNTKPVEPAPSEVGYMTWIGDPAGSNPGHMVLVDWVPRGHELLLLDTVRDFCDDAAKVIATRDMSYGDFLKWKAEHRTPDHWEHGKWFFRTDKVMKLAQTEEEEHGV